VTHTLRHHNGSEANSKHCLRGRSQFRHSNTLSDIIRLLQDIQSAADAPSRIDQEQLNKARIERFAERRPHTPQRRSFTAPAISFPAHNT
jgi:hypothetical protein